MKQKQIKEFILILFLTIISINIFSQVVNIEKKRKGDKEGFTGLIGVGFNLIDNGNDIVQLSNIIDLQYHKASSTYILLNDVNLMRVNEDDLINSGFQHFRYNYTVRDSSFFTIEAFAQHQYNTIKLLKQRFLIGAGPRFRLVNSKRATLFIGAIGLYEYEQLSDSLETKTELARLSSYISFSWDITSNLSFNNISYYQPAFTNYERFRIASETSLGLKISDALKFKVSFQTSYDSRPPEGVQKLFYSWINSLNYEF